MDVGIAVSLWCNGAGRTEGYSRRCPNAGGGALGSSGCHSHSIPSGFFKAILQNIRNDFSWQSPLSRCRQASPWVSSWRSSSVTLSFAGGEMLEYKRENIPPHTSGAVGLNFYSSLPEGHPHPPGCSIGFDALISCWQRLPGEVEAPKPQGLCSWL